MLVLSVPAKLKQVKDTSEYVKTAPSLNMTRWSFKMNFDFIKTEEREVSRMPRDKDDRSAIDSFWDIESLLPKKKEKKAFVITARVKRQYLTYFILLAIIISYNTPCASQPFRSILLAFCIHQKLGVKLHPIHHYLQSRAGHRG